jgi:hypothetical protein
LRTLHIAHRQVEVEPFGDRWLDAVTITLEGSAPLQNGGPGTDAYFSRIWQDREERATMVVEGWAQDRDSRVLTPTGESLRPTGRVRDWPDSPRRKIVDTLIGHFVGLELEMALAEAMHDLPE